MLPRALPAPLARLGLPLHGHLVSTLRPPKTKLPTLARFDSKNSEGRKVSKGLNKQIHRHLNVRLLRAISASSLIALAGCGGGGGSTPAPAPTPTPTPTPAPSPTPTPSPTPAPLSVLSGKVIDGYISGATVWLDINGNHRKDADEPFAVSKAAGDYRLELSEAQRSCLPYSTLYVDVPVGAVDEENGPVKEAYQMAVAPALQPISVEQLRHISPLTTAIWDAVRTRLGSAAQQANSCEELRQNEQGRANLAHEIKNVMGDLVQRHNLSEARIHDDFVKARDQQSHTLAVDIVKGLKAGYAHKLKLHEQYPDASFIRAEVYRGRGSNTTDDKLGAWYRRATVWRTSGVTEEWVALNDDLLKIEQVQMLRGQERQAWGPATLTITRTAYRFNSEETDYHCIISEGIEQTKDKQTYELLVHYKDLIREADPLRCMVAKLAPQTEVTQHEYQLSSWQGKTYYLGNMRFDAGLPESQALKDWQQLAGKSAQLDFGSVMKRIASSGIQFDEDVKLSASSWLKRSTDDSGLRVIVEKANQGDWTRTSTLTDGTSRKECSADRGKTWGACSV